ncbi:Carbamoyltransferase HypF [Gimesia panareensis]|uniref:Carbamoyltransferase n=2 Tax=Gimesia panareensis TaxID=2527978 RepID=A0A517QA93_9PLAN|nr:Carbamoyltransferase HypF [Gimesia panareensis]
MNPFMNRQAISNPEATQVAVQFLWNGRVQGIGLRPAVACWARELGLAGSICNTSAGVQLRVEGPAQLVARFEEELESHLPTEAVLETRERQPIECEALRSFEILESDEDGPLRTEVPRDRAVCPACLEELTDPADRRFQYPFISCTDCGPRYSLIRSMPYERRQTGMAEFGMCAECAAEYESAADRRFHAQTIACSECGPRVWCTDSRGREIVVDQAAIQAAAQALKQGQIVGLRGLGGYQFLADARSDAAVQKLRELKQRPAKPLAVMVSSLAEARTLAILNDTEEQELCSPAAPIVLLRARRDAGLSCDLNSGLQTVGVMLPTTPLHALLLNACEFPLVVTSANREGEPIACQADQIDAGLRAGADLWLEHDRPIERPIDDSVVRVMAGQSVTIRLARGLAPLPLPIAFDEPLIATGGQQKSAFAFCNGKQSVLGPHMGELECLPACERYLEQLQSLQSLYDFAPAGLVCDQHPDYFTTQWAERVGIPLEKVQHHYAHILAGMLEQGWLDRKVLGVALDGTGWGTDQTIWGGEFLLSTATEYERVGRLRPFALPGGEQAIREPWRIAVMLVAQSLGEQAALMLGTEVEPAEPLLRIGKSSRLSPLTSSAGRLFDGVAMLILGCRHSGFEGQPAMLLEATCDYSETGAYEMPIHEGELRELDWRPAVTQIWEDRRRGVSPGRMAMRFHRGLARAIARFGSFYSQLPVVLGGGVFQNRCLVELLAEEFAQSGQELGLPGRIPPNDGGLAAGQLALAIARREGRDTIRCV